MQKQTDQNKGSERSETEPIIYGKTLNIIEVALKISDRKGNHSIDGNGTTRFSYRKKYFQVHPI